MSHQVHSFEPPERFVAGTVGEPGDRTFFLQARGAGRVISVALEKVQVSLLAEKLEELLVEANKRFGVDLPEAPILAVHDNEPLDTPVDEEFRVGTLGLAFDVDSGTVVIEAIEAGEAEVEIELGEDDDAPDTDDDDTDDDDDEDDDEPDDDLDRLRVRLSPEATRAFIDRARRVVAAGRPPCPLCGQPLDPAGHLCPRHNGYHR
ncbi:DUF3090 domain-containing protein [Paractinoplanes durhamensis]|uniref:Repeat protein (TIGR03847 family) n=1 Tax=Paractinoplanes durhamensis TaxID=113563 RepID=A0ABQ3YSI6_9ACTN|nr:DUF3090 domain-containing protein [Actinoplanes durhamensis]GIE00556.1 hypothetical protein Adu01nite_19060 [Actinoplanes durhamensis]